MSPISSSDWARECTMKWKISDDKHADKEEEGMQVQAIVVQS
jgi:hypothetical protein